MVRGKIVTSDYGVTVFVEKAESHVIDDYGTEHSVFDVLVTNDYGTSVPVRCVEF
jgi:hypothetical protein